VKLAQAPAVVKEFGADGAMIVTFDPPRLNGKPTVFQEVSP
jgi:hypothetical protein